MILESTKDGIYECKVTNDKTGVCEWSIAIDSNDLSDLEKSLIKRTAEDLDKGHNKSTFSNVDDKIYDKFQEVFNSFNKLALEFQQKARARQDAILNLIMARVKIMMGDRQYWKEMEAGNIEKAGEVTDKTNKIVDQSDALTIEFNKVNIDQQPRIDLLKKRLTQIAILITKVDKQLAPEAYQHFTNIQSIMTQESTLCERIKNSGDSWVKLDAELREKNIAMTKQINEFRARIISGKKPNESKENIIQPASPTVLTRSSNSSNKSDSGNNSPIHSFGQSPVEERKQLQRQSHGRQP